MFIQFVLKGRLYIPIKQTPWTTHNSLSYNLIVCKAKNILFLFSLFFVEMSYMQITNSVGILISVPSLHGDILLKLTSRLIYFIAFIRYHDSIF